MKPRGARRGREEGHPEHPAPAERGTHGVSGARPRFDAGGTTQSVSSERELGARIADALAGLQRALDSLSAESRALVRQYRGALEHAEDSSESEKESEPEGDERGVVIAADGGAAFRGASKAYARALRRVLAVTLSGWRSLGYAPSSRCLFTDEQWYAVKKANTEATRSIGRGEAVLWSSEVNDNAEDELKALRYNAFFSHSGAQKDKVALLADYFRGDDRRIFLDQDGKGDGIPPGSDSERHMVGAVLFSEIAVVNLSLQFLVQGSREFPEYEGSEWPLYELLLMCACKRLETDGDRAFAARFQRIKIVPIAHSPSELPDPWRLKGPGDGSAWLHVVLALPLPWSSTNPPPVLEWHERETNQGTIDRLQQLFPGFARATTAASSTTTKCFKVRPDRQRAHFFGDTDLLHAMFAEAEKEAYKLNLSEFPNTVVLSGLGGIGKTELAIQYAHDVLHPGGEGPGHPDAGHPDAVFWLSAASQQELRQGLRELLSSHEGMGVSEAADEEVFTFADVSQNAHKWLAQHPNWVIIIDNADSAKDLLGSLDFLRGFDQVHWTQRVLITSRLRSSGFIHPTTKLTALPKDVVRDVRLNKLGLKHARLLLLDKAERSDTDGEATTAGIVNNRMQETEALDWLCGPEALDGLPLALVQAGSYVREKKMTFVKLREILGDNDLVVPDSATSSGWDDFFNHLDGVKVTRRQIRALKRAWSSPNRLAIDDVSTKDLLAELTTIGTCSFQDAEQIKECARSWRPGVPRVVKFLWTVTLQNLDLPAEVLLGTLAYLAVDHIPADVATVVFEQFEEELREELAEELRESDGGDVMDNAWLQLEEYSLITCDTSSSLNMSSSQSNFIEQSYSIHRLFAAAVREEHKIGTQKVLEAASQSNTSSANLKAGSSTNNASPLLHWLTITAQVPADLATETAVLLESEAYDSVDSLQELKPGDLARYFPKIKLRARRLIEAALGEPPSNVARVPVPGVSGIPMGAQVASAEQDRTGKYFSSAISAVHVKLPAIGDWDKEFAKSRKRLAAWDTHGAEVSRRAAEVGVLELLDDATQGRLWAVRCQLASGWRQIGRFSDAEAELKRLTGPGTAIGLSVRHRLFALYEHGMVLHGLGNYDEAIARLQDCAREQEHHLGKADVDTLTTRYRLANICFQDLSRLFEAKEECEKAYQILCGDASFEYGPLSLLFESLLAEIEAREGGDGYSTAKVQNLLNKLESLHERSRESFGDSHRTTMLVLNKFVQQLHWAKRTDEALQRHEGDVLPLYEAQLGHDHFMCWQIRSKIALLRGTQAHRISSKGKLAAATQDANLTQERLVRLLGVRSQHSAEAMLVYGRLLSYSGRYAEAVRIFREILPYTGPRASLPLAYTLFREGSQRNRSLADRIVKLEEAERLLVQAHDARRELYGGDAHKSVSNAHKELKRVRKTLRQYKNQMRNCETCGQSFLPAKKFHRLCETCLQESRSKDIDAKEVQRMRSCGTCEQAFLPAKEFHRLCKTCLQKSRSKSFDDGGDSGKFQKMRCGTCGQAFVPAKKFHRLCETCMQESRSKSFGDDDDDGII